MDLGTKITLSSGVTYRRIEDEMVLLDLDSECYFGLDEVGARCWELLEEHGRLQPVYEALMREYDVEPTRLEADLLRLVSELERAGLVASSPVADSSERNTRPEPE